MAPKKKGNKKADDDWEAELGETVDPIAAAVKEANEVEASKDPEDDSAVGGGGGLLAALKKNKSKKQKKGKPVEEDYLDGEDPSATNGAPSGIEELASKAPEEANADELFDAQLSKTKGGKGKQGKTEVEAKEDEDVSGDEGGGLKSKKEKEKEKKEREKQRKKEQVQMLEDLSFCIRETDRISMLGR